MSQEIHSAAKIYSFDIQQINHEPVFAQRGGRS